MTDELMTLKSLTRYLGVDKVSINRWQQRGLGPPQIKIGNRIWYSRQMIQDWITSCRVHSSSASPGISQIPAQLQTSALTLHP